METQAPWSGERRKVYTRKPHFPRSSSSTCILSSLQPLCVRPTRGTVLLGLVLELAVYLSSSAARGEHFSFSASQGQELGHSGHRWVLRVMGVQEEGHG